jgi:hypothetical protein
MTPEAIEYCGKVLRNKGEDTRLRLKAAKIILLHGMPKGDALKYLSDQDRVTSITIELVNPDGTKHEWNESPAAAADAAAAKPPSSGRLQNALGTSSQRLPARVAPPMVPLQARLHDGGNAASLVHSYEKVPSFRARAKAGVWSR